MSHYTPPPKPTHVKGTQKGEEMVIRHGREPGRTGDSRGGHRTARDSTSVNPDARRPIDPRMPSIPPT